MTELQVEEFLNEAIPSVYYNMIIFAIETGLRASELAGIKIGDIDFENNILKLQRQIPSKKEAKKVDFVEPKTEKSIRLVPLTERACEALNAQIEKNGHIKVKLEAYNYLIFKNRNGDLIFPCDFNKGIKYIVNRINKKREIEAEKNGTIYEPFPNVHPHALRYTFATHAAYKEMAPNALQKILGHTDIRTTLNYYVQTNEDFLKKEILKIERVDSFNTNIISLSKYKQKNK